MCTRALFQLFLPSCSFVLFTRRPLCADLHHFALLFHFFGHFAPICARSCVLCSFFPHFFFLPLAPHQTPIWGASGSTCNHCIYPLYHMSIQFPLFSSLPRLQSHHSPLRFSTYSCPAFHAFITLFRGLLMAT